MIGNLISLLPYWFGILCLSLILRSKEKVVSKEILWASTRTTIQLILLSLALEKIFESTSMIMGLILSLVMTVNSSWQIWLRSKYKNSAIFWNTLFSNTMAIWPLAFLFSIDQGGFEWATPQVILPLLGMLLGNSLNGVSIALENFHKISREKKDEILSYLAMGATESESIHRIFSRSLRAGITPHINSMISMGIVSIPGMMAGQLISKADAINAALIQIKMMFCVCSGTVMSIYIALWLARRKLFLNSGELCLE